MTKLREFAACVESDLAGSCGAIEAEWQRLGVLRKKVEDLSSARQQAMIAHRRRFYLPFDVPKYTGIFYQYFNNTRLLLLSFVQLRERSQTLRSDRVEALSRGQMARISNIGLVHRVALRPPPVR